MSDRVAVIGGGSWGTAVGTIIGASHPASLWVRSPELAASMAETRRNEKYLPDVQLPDGLTVTSSLAEALQGVSIVFMAVPSHGFRAVLTDMQPLAGDIEAVVSLAKGIEMGTNLRMSQVVDEVLPGVPPASSPDRTWPARWRRASGCLRGRLVGRGAGEPRAGAGAHAHVPYLYGHRRRRV